MITYGWGRDLASESDVAAMLAEAAQHDAEQGFQPLPRLDPRARADVWELVVRLRRPAGDGGRRRIWVNAAYLRVGGQEEGRLIVRPDYRSLGVATSLAERLGVDPEIDGAAPGPELMRVWAHGAHPAAERMARRFGLVADLTETELVVPLGSGRAWWPTSGPVELIEVDRETCRAHLAAVGQGSCAAGGLGPRVRLAARAADGTTVGLAVAARIGREDGEATVEFLEVRDGHRGAGVGRSLLGGLLTRLSDAGRTSARIVVGEKDGAVPMLRSLGFRHDQTNLRYGTGSGPFTPVPVVRRSVR